MPHANGVDAEVVITAHGEAATLGDLDLSDLGTVKRRRVGRIEPARPLKRVVFRLLRALADDRGRIAAWTRRWRGPWRACVLATGETHAARSREACLQWERSRVRL